MTVTQIQERPVIFTAPMVRAIDDGRKTQTRRIAKFSEVPGDVPNVVVEPYPGEWIAWWTNRTPAQALEFSRQEYKPGEGIRCPYGQPGDRLWVRESIYIDHVDYPSGPLPKERPRDVEIYYRADGECCDQIPECSCAEVGKPKWRNPRFMPKWAARLWLDITRVRVERVQDISEADAIAEGCQSHYCSPEDTASCKPGTPERKLAELLEGGFLTAKNEFIHVWRCINGHDSWDSNPWVFVIEFKRAAEGGGA